MNVLQELLDNDGVENIYIDGFEQTLVTYVDGRSESWPPATLSDDALISIVQDLAARPGWGTS